MRIHEQYAQALYKKMKKKNVRMLSIPHWSLCQAILDPNLQQFEDRTVGKSPGDPAWAEQNTDHGAGYYCARTFAHDGQSSTSYERGSRVLEIFDRILF